MNDLHTLDDVFAEYERRADQATPTAFYAPPTGRSRRPVVIAASVVAVAGLAVGAVALADRTHAPHDGGRAATAPSVSTPVTTLPETVIGSPVVSPTGSTPTPSTTPSTRTHSAKALFRGDFEAAFRRVLGDSATFTVTDSDDAFLSGVLTTSSGVRGGYDIQIYQDPKGSTARCSDDFTPAQCETRRLPDGSTLAVGAGPLYGAAGSVTQEVTRVLPNGVTYLMGVTNQRSTKGSSPKLSAQPPLTTAQMVQVVTSHRW